MEKTPKKESLTISVQNLMSLEESACHTKKPYKMFNSLSGFSTCFLQLKTLICTQFTVFRGVLKSFWGCHMLV
jgi:hypothetical protein